MCLQVAISACKSRASEAGLFQLVLKPTHGVSLDVNPATLEKWGPHQIESIPDELKIIQRGQRLEHFEVVPRQPMTIERFQELLNEIKLYKPK